MDWEEDWGAGSSQPHQGGAADPLVDQEYARIQQRYTDAGYREGITDGKLSTLQAGFDCSFAASVPASRRLGQLRGRANALLAIVCASAPPARARGGAVCAPAGDSAGAADSPLVEPVRALVADLARVRRGDVLPEDLERLAHERDEHGDHAFELAHTEGREMEGLEDMLGRLGAGGGTGSRGAPPAPALREEALLCALEARMLALEEQVGLA